MKRVLSLVLALVLVLGMIPTFAADMTGAEHLQEHGFISGNETGDLMVDNMLTREQLAAVIAELNGVKEEAAAFALPPAYADVAKIGAWAKPFVAYAQVQTPVAWMSGKPGNMFDPKGQVPAQQLAAVLMNVLGYEFTYATVLEDAAAIGIEFTNEGALTRGEAFEAMWTAVNTAPNGEELALGVLLGRLPDPTPVPVVLAVESATATNLKEIVVKFNTTLDAKKVVVGNFKVAGVDAASVTLSEDKTTVVVVPATISAVNPASYALVVKAAVGIAADYSATVKPFDTTLPVVQSVTLTGPQTFEIKFSEPMKTVGTVKVNNGIYGVTVPAAITGDTATITLAASSLPEANYTVTVAGYKDYAGFSISSTDLTLAYVKDTAIPVATISGTPTQTQVVVKFDKVVTLDNTSGRTDYFYHTFTAWKPDTVVADADGKTFTLTFTTYPIPAGTTNVVVNYKGTVANSNIVDAWGNKVISNIVLPVTVTADTSAPTVTAVTVTNEQTVVVKFSESLNLAAAKAKAEDETNFVVKDSNGKAVTTTFTNTYAETPADGLYKVTMAFASKLTGGTYTVEIKNLIDSSLNANVMTTNTQSFTVSDLTPIDFAVANDVVVTAVESTEADVADIIYVTFSEPMAITGQYSVLSTSNYLLNGAALPTGSTIASFGTTGKVIKISVDENATFNQQTVAGATLTIARVADLAGNATIALYGNETVNAEVPAIVTSVEQTDSNKVTVTVNKPLSVVLASGLKVNGGLTVAAIDSWSVNSDNETIINATLDATDASSATDTAAKIANLDVVANILVSETGVKMAAGSYAVTEARAPKLIATNPIVAGTANGTIEVKFTEALDAVGGIAALYANDLVVTKANGTVLVPGLDYTTTLTNSDKNIVITFTAAQAADTTYKVSSKATISYIRDAVVGVNTKAVAFPTVVDVVAKDNVAPTATSVTSAVYTVGATDKLVITGVGFGAVGDIVDVTKITVKDTSATINAALTTSTGVVTNATTLTITISAADKATLATIGGADVTIDVANAVLKDAAGNVSPNFGAAQTGKAVTVN